MKKIPGILVMLMLTSTLWGQKVEIGIHYIPIVLSRITFDEDYIIFDDNTSMPILDDHFKLCPPSLSNTGLFVQLPLGHVALQTGINFQTNLYFYSVDYFYQGMSKNFYYSSLDIPLMVTYTFNQDAIRKFRLLAGINSKMFKIKRNYFSVFSQAFDHFYIVDEYESDRLRRKSMTDNIRPFGLFARVGLGIEYYGITADLWIDKNLTRLNEKNRIYNADYEDAYLISMVLGFTIPSKDLHVKKSRGKINKE
jgi:hypothetical protein